MRVLLSSVACLFAVSCQTYDFEKVTPLAVAQTTQSRDIISKQLKPNLMLLVDKSGSMNEKIVSTCTGAACATRISELKSAMQTFTTTSGTVARLGLALFPTGPGCPPTTALATPLPMATNADTGTDMALKAKATEVNTAIQAIVPSGGTPTGASLGFVGTTPGLLEADNRKDFILLLTDGLPNCNDANPNQICNCNPTICGAGSCATATTPACGAQISACECTQGSLPTSCSGGTLCKAGCLDKDATTAKIAELKGKGIQTIVVGFGADFVGPAVDTLNAMADSGGFPRRCPMGMDSECGSGNTCTVATKLCNFKFYKASNAAELSSELAKISSALDNTDPCVFQLDAQPTDPRLLAVIFNGQNLAPATDSWNYTGGTVNFVGKYCSDITNSTPASPVNVSIRIIEQF
jgi:hypothetical protein